MDCGELEKVISTQPIVTMVVKRSIGMKCSNFFSKDVSYPHIKWNFSVLIE